MFEYPHRSGAARQWHGVGDRVVGQDGDVGGGQAEIRQRHRDVGLAAAEGGHELRGCRKRSKPGGASRSMISPKVTMLSDMDVIPG